MCYKDQVSPNCDGFGYVSSEAYVISPHILERGLRLNLDGSVELLKDHSACNTKAQLIDRIKEVFEALPMDTVKDTCARLQS